MRILLTNMCNDGNRGDLAILEGTVAALRTAAPDARIAIAPSEVAEPELLLGEEMENSRRLADEPLIPSPVPAREDNHLATRDWMRRTLRALSTEIPALGGRFSEPPDDAYVNAVRSADFVIAKGGSWLFSYPGLGQAVFGLRMLHQLRIAQQLGVPTAVLGTSLGPWQPALRKIYAQTLRRCVRVVTREELSHRFAQEHGLTNLARGTDMAFALYVPHNSGVAKRGVAVTPRELPHVGEPERVRYEAALVRTVQRVVDEHREQVFIALQVDRDLGLAKRLLRRIDRSGWVTLADHVNRLGIPDLIEWYGSRKLVIGTRLHSVILAALQHTPSVILECDPPKMVGLSEQLTLDRWRVDAATEAIEGLPELVDLALGKATETGAELPGVVADLAGVANRSAAELLAAVA